MTAYHLWRLRRLINLEVVALTHYDSTWTVWLTPLVFDSGSSGPLHDTRRQYHPWEQIMGRHLGSGETKGEAFRAARRAVRTARLTAER